MTGISNKTISHIKADWRMQSSSLRSHEETARMELSDFDKCEICINCKIIQADNKQDNKLYIINKIFGFGFRYTISSLLLKKDITNVYMYT